MVAWGVISIATAFATSQTQLIALRFVLGVAEGGMLRERQKVGGRSIAG